MKNWWQLSFKDGFDLHVGDGSYDEIYLYGYFSGFLADPKVDYLDTVNPLSFIYNLEALIKDSAWRKKLGDRAFAIALQRSWDAILAELVGEYEILINAANKKLLRA